MQAWLPVFDRAAQCLQSAHDAPAALVDALHGHSFPIDWIPFDAPLLPACSALYPLPACAPDAPPAKRRDDKQCVRNRSLLMLAARFGKLRCCKLLMGDPYLANPAAGV